MKKSLLFLAAIAATLGASAQRVQTQLGKEFAAPTQKVFSPLQKELKGLKAPRRIAPKSTTVAPTAFYYRPDGLFYVGQNYQGSMGRGYTVAPADYDLQFYGDVQAENSSWYWTNEIDADAEQYVISTLDIATPEDSVLSVSFPRNFWPAPELVGISQVGQNKLTAKPDTASYNLNSNYIFAGGSTAKIFGNDEGNIVMPAVNYDTQLYQGAGNLNSDFAVNSEEANVQCAEDFEVAEAINLGFFEFFWFAEGAQALINSADAVVYSADDEFVPENVEATLFAVQDGRLSSVLGTLTLDDNYTLSAQNGGVWGYGLHFITESPLVIDGPVALYLTTAEGAETSFCPKAMVTTTTDDSPTCYVYFAYKETGEEEEWSTYIGNATFYWAQDGSMINPAWNMGLEVSYDAEEIANATEGVKDITLDRKAAGTFDLQGRRAIGAQKGVFIVDGKKVIK